MRWHARPYLHERHEQMFVRGFRAPSNLRCFNVLVRTNADSNLQTIDWLTWDALQQADREVKTSYSKKADERHGYKLQSWCNTDELPCCGPSFGNFFENFAASSNSKRIRVCKARNSWKNISDLCRKIRHFNKPSNAADEGNVTEVHVDCFWKQQKCSRQLLHNYEVLTVRLEDASDWVASFSRTFFQSFSLSPKALYR